MKGLSMMLVLVMLVLAGCGGGVGALILDQENVEQSVKLNESYKVKNCHYGDGSGSFWSINGNIKSYTAVGEVSYADCWKSFNPNANVTFSSEASKP